MTHHHALVLTGEILPGFAPEAVWSGLATAFRASPEAMAKLRARAPQIIKQGDDLDKLSALQGRIAQAGARAEIYPLDDRSALFVLIGDAPHGPVPRALIEQYLKRGLWTVDSIEVAETGSTTWKPYREPDAAELSIEPLQPLAPPLPARSCGGMAATRPGARTATSASRPNFAARMPGTLPESDAVHAGFWRRNAALALDGLILCGPQIILFIVPVIGWPANIVGTWLYFALMESSQWQATIGKRVMGIKAVDEYGCRIGFGRATGRYFGKIVSGLILSVGYMMAGWTSRKQALHDMMAGTFVVFDSVRPGQPLPAKRLPMPWYGWVLNIALPLFSIVISVGIAAAIVLPAHRDYAIREKVASAMIWADVIQTGIASQGCQASRHRSPFPGIESTEITDDESGSCTITLTFGQSANIAPVLRGGEVRLTRHANGGWVCSSSLPARYLPRDCR